MASEPNPTSRREFLQSIPTASALFAVAGHLALEGGNVYAQGAAPAAGHFHPKGKGPSVPQPKHPATLA
ncbi:MAG: hypothetical protein AAGD14_15105 [Planctomycetota bacterium]